MAPTKQATMKRPAAAPQHRAAKRQMTAEAQAASKQCDAVAKALLESSDFPADVLDMLSSSLPGCVVVPKEQRHKFQEDVIGMIGEVLAKGEAGLQAVVVAAEAKLGGVWARKEEGEASEQTAAGELTAKEDALAAATTAAAEAGNALSEAKEAVAAAEAGKANVETELEALAGQRARLSSSLSDVFLPIKEGSAELAKVQEGLAAVMAVGKDFSFDSTLLKALPSAGAKALADRGTFDALVMQQLEAEFERCSAELDQKLANAEPAKREREAKAAEATAALDGAKSREQECAAALDAAKAAQKEALAAKRAASKALRETAPELKQAKAELNEAKASLEKFSTGPAAAFEALRELSETPAVEAKEAEELSKEEAKMEEAAPKEAEDMTFGPADGEAAAAIPAPEAVTAQ